MDKNVYRATAVAALKEKNAYYLSSDAGCGALDTLTSEGAQLLTGVRDSVVELIEGLDIDTWHDAAESHHVQSLNDRGEVDELVNGAPSLLTMEKWRQFVDLNAFEEDPSNCGDFGGDMDRMASICLYMIAERLAWVLLEEAAGTYLDILVDIEEFENALKRRPTRRQVRKRKMRRSITGK